MKAQITAIGSWIPFVAWTLGCTGLACAQNLIVNGDFEGGNVGFLTDYTYSPGDIWLIGTYDVVADVSRVHPLAELYHDHTTGNGLMLAANGALPGLPVVWSQTVTVTPGLRYEFSAWAANWAYGSSGYLAPLEFRINGTRVAFWEMPMVGEWFPVSAGWDAGAATIAVVTVVDLSEEWDGNDPALDDLWLGLLGDLNCDGRVDFDDIDPFVLALSDPAGYHGQYASCNILVGDINGDGLVNFDDIDAFVALLSAGPASGACCYDDGTCVVTPPADCTGIWHPEWPDCAGVDCSPPGDTCGSPKIIWNLPYDDVDDSCNFHDDYEEVCSDTGSTAPDVAYRFTPDRDMLIRASLCNDDTCYDTEIYIYEGGCPGTRIACNDDFCATACSPYPYVSQIEEVQVLGGHSYYIIVDGLGSACGQYHLTVTEVMPCTVECPPGSYLEQEICGYDTNGGCNMGWPEFEVLPDLPFFEAFTVCGTLWFDGTIRDTDWYEIALLQPAVVDVWGQGTANNMVFGWLEQVTPGVPGCENITGYLEPYFVAARCVEGWYSIGLCVPAGTYYLFAATDFSHVNPCPVDYVMTILVNPYDPGGACCVDGVCTENQMWWICEQQGGTFFECQHCAGLDPPCESAAGACISRGGEILSPDRTR